MIVDVQDETLAKEREAIAALKQLPKLMLQAVENGATFEKRFKTYKNRTGDLRRSTRGYLAPQLLSGADGAETFVVLEMGMPYASFVKKMGLSEIDTARKYTNQAISDAVKKCETAAGG